MVTEYVTSLKNDEVDWPFCPTCYDNNSKVIRLKHTLGATFEDWNCLVCKGHFQ